MSRVHQRSHGNIVGIGKGSFFAADCANAHALVDAERAGFDNTLFQAPTFGAGVLKVQVRVINLVGTDGRQSLGEMGFVQTVRGQEKVLRDGQSLEGGFA